MSVIGLDIVDDIQDAKRTIKGTGKDKEFTRDLARALIGNPVNALVTQHPYQTEFVTGVPVADIFHLAGFDMVDGVWHSRPEAWQQIGGYNDIYDVIFDYATSMEKDKFKFSSGERDYIFWAWKGDYLNLGAGAELGLYTNESGILGQVNVTSPFSEHWLVDTSLAMPMTMSLSYKGEEIASYAENHWWITSFNPYYQNVNASDLRVTFSVDFTGHETIFNDFSSTELIRNDPRWIVNDINNVTFDFK